MDYEYLTVSQLSQYIKRKFDQDPYLGTVYIKGEVSNSGRNRPNANQYFSLKDDQNVISVVLFRDVAKRVKFKLEDGMSVLIQGRVATYGPRGIYQIVVSDIQPDGVGALYQALEQTKKALAKEGLFRSDHKKPLVKFPKRIAAVTSESGAVIQDIKTTLERRYPLVELVLFPTRVQGKSAISSIVKNIRRADESASFDTIIVGRGGGSIEDLWGFNDEKVVRAIYQAQTPIISSVGHETDTSLSDLAADVRAATPTAAAELAVPLFSDINNQILEYTRLLHHHARRLVENRRQALDRVNKSYIFKQPNRLYEGYIQNIDHLTSGLYRSFRQILAHYKRAIDEIDQTINPDRFQKYILSLKLRSQSLKNQLDQNMKDIQDQKHRELAQLTQALDHLSPLEILSRGYAYASQEGQVLRSVDQASKDQNLTVRLADGQLETKILSIRKEKGADKHDQWKSAARSPGSQKSKGFGLWSLP